MKKVILFTLCFLLLGSLFVSPVLADLSYEQGLADWEVEHRQDSWPGTSHEYTSDVVSTRYSDGVQSVRLGAKVIGDYSDWLNTDKTQTIVWKGPYDLTRGLSISVDMADIQHAIQQYYWGWGMEADLILSDGTNETRSLLWDYHEENTGLYGPPGLEDNLYSSIVTGTDGTEWYRYNVPLTADKWGGTDFGGGPLANLDLSHVKIGVVYAATNWHSSPQTLWANGLVDNVRIEYQPNINVDPDTLNLKSAGKEKSLTVYTDFPYARVDVGSLTLNGVPATSAEADEDGNLKCKFDRQAVIAIVAPPEATLTLTGETVGGVPITGSDTIRVIYPGK